MQARAKFLIVSAVMLFVIVFVSSSVQASPDGLEIVLPSRSSPVVTLDASPAEEAATLAMWTREAIATAQPMPFPTEFVDEKGSGLDIERILKSPGQVPSQAPAMMVDDVAKAEFPEDWQMVADDLELTSYEMAPTAVEGSAGIFTGYYVNRYSQMHRYFPYKAIGKLTFTTPTGGASCTASVISPKKIIVTAAHCVYDTANNRWYSNWAFSPAWRNGAAPYGTFPWRNARILRGWINASGIIRRYDVAIIRLGNNSAGRPVTYYTGSLGRSWNYPYKRNLHAIGYPSNINSGRYSYACTAETYRGATDVLNMGCNMKHGSSGGPWLRKYAPYAGGNANYVISVVSGPAATRTFNGPRFSSNNIVPLCSEGDWTC